MPEFKGVPFKELLDKAHKIGLQGVETELIHADYASPLFVFRATVKTPDGAYTAHGEAHPNNTNRMIVPHLLRMAESRAIARALRWATNTGEAASDELSEEARAEAPAQTQPPVTSSSSAPPNNARTIDEALNQKKRCIELLKSDVFGEEERIDGLAWLKTPRTPEALNAFESHLEGMIEGASKADES
jgi:hypothetical protein